MKINQSKWGHRPIIQRRIRASDDVWPPEIDLDAAVSTGDLVAQGIEHLGMSRDGLAGMLGVTGSTVHTLIKGKTVITAEWALKLESIFGLPAETWMDVDSRYRLKLEREKNAII